MKLTKLQMQPKSSSHEFFCTLQILHTKTAYGFDDIAFNTASAFHALLRTLQVGLDQGWGWAR
jgi:hypothetical protein